MQNGHTFEDATASDRAIALLRMCKISKLSWNEVVSTQRHGLGTEKIAQKSLNVALPLDITADVTLLAFRAAGLKPIIGYRDRFVFHVLFFDHNFTVYNH